MRVQLIRRRLPVRRGCVGPCLVRCGRADHQCRVDADRDPDSRPTAATSDRTFDRDTDLSRNAHRSGTDARVLSDLPEWPSCLHREPRSRLCYGPRHNDQQTHRENSHPAGPPQFIAFAPDGDRAYVSIYNEKKTVNLTGVLDTRTVKLLRTIPVDQKPFALAVSPDQRFVYVPSHDAGALDIISVSKNEVVDRIKVAPNPHWVAFSPDGKSAYIANHESNVVSVLDVQSGVVVKKIPVGTSPHSVAVSPDGKQVAVVCFDSDDLYFIDTTTNEVQKRVAVGTSPQDVSYAADGRYVYTADVDSNTVTVVDAETKTETASIPTDSPTSIAVLPNGKKAYVTNVYAGTVTVLNTAQ